MGLQKTWPPRSPPLARRTRLSDPLRAHLPGDAPGADRALAALARGARVARVAPVALQPGRALGPRHPGQAGEASLPLLAGNSGIACD